MMSIFPLNIFYLSYNIEAIFVLKFSTLNLSMRGNESEN
jgi:hypothetical protein